MPLCWICGAEATTGEHIVKKSDLAAVFGSASQDDPLFLHNETVTNYKLQSLNAKALKLPSRICAKCNNQSTQPFDRAWEAFSKFALRRCPPLKVGDAVRADRIYLQASNARLKDVQLYFVKLFGCLIDGEKIPVDLTVFAKALRDRTYHRNVYLKLGRVPRDPDNAMAGISPIIGVADATGKTVGVSWFYELNGLAMKVSYVEEPDRWQGFKDDWHPSRRTGKFIVADFTKVMSQTAA